MTACSVKKVEIGDTVSVQYTGTLDNGTVFDSSEGKSPLTFKVGAGEMISGFDNAVMGMKVGEEKNIVLQPSEAYGAWDPTRIAVQPRKNVNIQGELNPGMILIATAPNGNQMPVKVLNVSDTNVTIDLNHPLAGKVLHFNVKVVKIE